MSDEENDISDLIANVFEIGEDVTAPAAAPEPSLSPVGSEDSGAGGDGASTPPAPQPAGEPAQPVQAPAQEAPAAPAAEPQQPAAAPEPPDPRDLELASLKAQLAQLLDQQKAAPAAPAAQPEDGLKPSPPIQVQLPNELLAMINSEDHTQSAQGINTLVSVIATGLTQRFEAGLMALESKVMERFAGQSATATVEQEQQEAAQHRDNYFKAFPDHNKPVLMPILAQQAAELAAEFPGVPWNEQFINALGARVNASLGGIMPQAPAAQPAPAKPAAMMPQGSRSEEPSADDLSNVIFDTFTA